MKCFLDNTEYKTGNFAGHNKCKNKNIQQKNKDFQF